MTPMANSTDPWTDEDLSAFIDGALDPERHAALEAQLGADASLAARLGALVDANDAIKHAFDAPLVEPVPARFQALLAETTAPPRPTGSIMPFPIRPQPPAAHAWRMAMAAGVALVVGAIGGGVGAGLLAPRDGALMARLGPALQTTASAQTAQLGGQETLKPILTFVAADGRFCREFEYAQRGDGFVGVACMEGKIWRLEAMLAAETRADAADGYRQATGHAAVALDAVLSALGAQEPLSAEAEKEALATRFAQPQTPR